jgi:hypothetical protein
MITPERPDHAYAPLSDQGHAPVREESRRDAKLDRERTSRRAKARDDSWGVQVGAYRGRGEAREQLAALTHRYSKLGDADRDVQSGGRGYYRARFSGLSAAQARHACAVMHAHHQTCEVVAPEG